MVEEHDHLRRDATEILQALALDHLEHRRGIEGVVHDRCAPVGDLDRDPRHRPDVREGEARGEMFRRGRCTPRMAATIDLGQGEEVPVVVPGALRDAGRPAREDDRDGIIGCGGNGRRRTGAASEIGDRVRRPDTQPIRREPDDLGEPGKLGAEPLDRAAEVRLVPLLDREQAARAGAAEDVADLAPPVADVDAGRDGAETRGAEVGDQVEGGGRQEERHHVASPHAPHCEAGRDPVGERVPVGVGEPLVPVAERLGCGRLARRVAQEVGDGGGAHDQSSHSRSRRYRSSTPRSAFISPKRSIRSATRVVIPSCRSVR